MHIKYFIYLNKHKHLAPRTISKSISQISSEINNHDIYTKFIFYIFFSDVCETLECPGLLKKLCSFKKIIDCIKKDLFTKTEYLVNIKDLPTNFRSKIIKSNDYTQEELFSIYKFLLNIELNIHYLYLVDIDGIFKLLCCMNSESKIRLLNLQYKISPLVCLLLVSIEDESIINSKYLELYYFLRVVNLDFRNGFSVLDSKNLNYKKIEKSLLYSNYRIINEYHKIFVNYYPEIIFNTKLNKSRLEFINNPLCMPIDYKVLKNYILCVPYILKITNIKLNDPNFDLLFRTIYIERILREELNKKWCKLLHILILDNCNLLYILLRRKFDIKHIRILVKSVPSFHLAFDFSLQLYKETNDNFYKTILECLVQKYPIEEYFKKLVPYKEMFYKKYRKYFDNLEK